MWSLVFQQSEGISSLDEDVKSTLVNNQHLLAKEEIESVTQAVETKATVPWGGLVGLALELLIALIAYHPFYSQDSEDYLLPKYSVYFYYFIRFALEQLLLAASWEFWEQRKTSFRSSMLKQLTLRNLLFQLRYFLSNNSSRSQVIFLVQPCVVLTMVLIDLMVERVQQTAGLKRLITQLITEIGVHVYFAFLLAEWNGENESDSQNLLLRTFLLTLVFQSDLLMFPLLFVASSLIIGGSYVVTRFFDCLVLVSAAELIASRLQDKTGVNYQYSLKELRKVFWSCTEELMEFVGQDKGEYAEKVVFPLHPLFEIAGFIFEAQYSWFRISEKPLLPSFLFFLAFVFNSLLRKENRAARSSIYVVEFMASISSFSLLNIIESDNRLFVVSYLALALSLLATWLSCAGMRDLLHVVRL
jgi:hypothetical protein